MTIYGIKNCDSVRKAVKFFKTHEITYDFVDFKTTKIDEEKIHEWMGKSSIDLLFNNRGTTYRTLKLKGLNLDEDGKAKWLAKENMLIKRPVIEIDGEVIVGFNEEAYQKRFI